MSDIADFVKKYGNTPRVKPENLVRLIQWIGFIRDKRVYELWEFSRSSLGFAAITQGELDSLCDLANHYLLDTHQGHAISNSMGEIVPSTALVGGNKP